MRLLQSRARRRPTTTLTVLAAASLLVAACGADGDAAQSALSGAEGSASTQATTTVAPANDETTVTEADGGAGVPTLADDGSGEAGEDAPAETDGTDDAAAELPADPGTVRPGWIGTRILPTDADGVVPPQETPPEMYNRRFPTIEIFPAPSDDTFQSVVGPVPDDVLARSTWQDGCPVTVDELRYLRMTFWGFDGLHHQGEMIVHRDVADDVVGVFAALHEVRFPIEEMRVTAQPELEAPPTGDGNNTTGFVCRSVVGSSTTFSQHAYGLAVDINPFHNPYQKGDVVLPELSTDYLDRDDVRPGMIFEGGPVVNAFDAIGWGWGGRWNSLDDYHHFSLNNR
ncbi:MAG: M15 family metallopeptidase [Actinomycetota bacterium]